MSFRLRIQGFKGLICILRKVSFFLALKMQILNTVGLQIRPNVILKIQESLDLKQTNPQNPHSNLSTKKKKQVGLA